jgi:rod shape-determining protein MreC
MMVRKRKLVYAGAAGLLLLVAFVLPPAPTLTGKSAVRNTVAPAERGAAGIGQRLSEAVSAIRGIGGAVEKTRELDLQNNELKTKLEELQEIEEENRRLRQALRFSQKQSFSMIPCEVTSRSISGWWNTVRIGKGTADGIRKNGAVISPDGLVGKVIEVSRSTAVVLLVCDPACRVSARIRRANTFGLVRGMGVNLRGHPVARMDFIDKDTEIRVGDEVVTSGLSGEGGASPRGLHIGYITKVQRDESGLYQYAEIAPSATVSLLDYLLVVSEADGEAAP